MVSKNEKLEEAEPVEVSKAEPVEKEDAPHKALREIIELYKVKNPVKYAMKKDALEAKMKKKLAFGRALDGSLLDGRADPQTGKRIPLEIVVVK